MTWSTVFMMMTYTLFLSLMIFSVIQWYFRAKTEYFRRIIEGMAAGCMKFKEEMKKKHE